MKTVISDNLIEQHLPIKKENHILVSNKISILIEKHTIKRERERIK